MNKGQEKTTFTVIILMLLCWPFMAFSDSSAISFNPPPGDFSVIFLSNIFGIVEGVLHGTGSQILGNMFSIFNSAVMALGSILIMYTLVVGTMNTAHEGQFLGQKWSSIWVPMRSVFGMSLLIPQSSGYCMMQIMVMWVVVQGVGAADKIWNVALDYLNRGGVIVQAQIPAQSSLHAANSQIAQGASIILEGQVCMLAIQNALEKARSELQASAAQKLGPCYNAQGVIKGFCDITVPDFISSVNTVTYQQKQDSAAGTTPPSSYEVKMPNFVGTPPYDDLSGICGSIKWNNFASQNATGFKNISTYDSKRPNTISVSTADLSTAKLSRAVAIQQMYTDLATVAQAIISNAPVFTPTTNPNTQPALPGIALSQYGIPETNQGVPCAKSDSTCVSWGGDTFSRTPPLFNGTEFQGAIADYNAIMLPTLRLLAEGMDASSQSQARAFIADAEQQGWIMAGSYFFYLARLNAVASQYANLTDTGGSSSDGTGLQTSVSPVDKLAAIFQQATNCPSGTPPLQCACSGSFPSLCQWLSADSSSIQTLRSLLDGTSIPGIMPALTLNLNNPQPAPVTGPGSSTIIGFITNSMIVHLPDQPGMQPPKISLHFDLTVRSSMQELPSQDFSCNGNFWTGCIGSIMGNILYNIVIRTMFNILMSTMAGIVNSLVIALISQPLILMSTIFLAGLHTIQQPSVNPLIALANMGVQYINFASQLWIELTILSVSGSLIPILGMTVIPLIMLIMPLVAAWLGIMVVIGFATAYYVPFLPYMIFTFGSIGWLIAVIEAMTAAPIVALGVCFPEGHEAFGKSEHAVLILMNVFLRPAMMVIGYVAAIILTYVSVWVLNAGFANAIIFMQGDPNRPTYSFNTEESKNTLTHGLPSECELENARRGIQSIVGSPGQQVACPDNGPGSDAGRIDFQQGYPGWAGIFGFFMAVLLYTSMYLTLVQEAFNLIHILPDKVLRWIGGQAESIGAETGKWGDQVKGHMAEAGKATTTAVEAMGSKMQKSVEKGLEKGKGDGDTPNVSASKGAGGP